jgi:hypothetical protein
MAALRLNLKKLLMLFVVACTPAFAHHGNAAYDDTKEVTLRGTVTEFDWANPHTQIYFDVKEADGNVVHWGCETQSPGRLMRAGWSKEAVRRGDQITITLIAAKNGAPIGYLHKLVFADGRTLGIGDLPQ